MIVFLGAGQDELAWFATLFGAQPDYRSDELEASIRNEPANWDWPESDPLADPKARLRILQTLLQGEELATLAIANERFVHFADTFHRLDPAAKIILVVRDGREFARSAFYHDEHTDRHGAFNRKPERDNPFSENWEELHPIPKLAWIWNFRLSKAIQRLDAVPKTQWAIARVEDVQPKSPSYEPCLQMLESFLGVRANRTVLPLGIPYPSSDEFPLAEDWTEGMNEAFAIVAGHLMAQLSYEIPGFPPGN